MAGRRRLGRRVGAGCAVSRWRSSLRMQSPLPKGAAAWYPCILHGDARDSRVRVRVGGSWTPLPPCVSNPCVYMQLACLSERGSRACMRVEHMSVKTACLRRPLNLAPRRAWILPGRTPGAEAPPLSKGFAPGWKRGPGKATEALALDAGHCRGRRLDTHLKPALDTH